ncbi:MAG TPA: PEP-utilizing enzyme [Streptosporangiaceae bacterium]|jgi:hypothetical protein
MNPAGRGELISTKALTLRRLAPLIKTASVDVGHIISRWNWRERAPIVVEFLSAAYAGAPLIIRSSSRNEDGWLASAAGKYDSIAVSDHDQPGRLRMAIDQVFSSYRDEADDSYVFVQRYIEDITAVSVVTTRVVATGAPYYVLAIDDSTHDSDAITSGRGLHARTWYISREDPALELPGLVRQLLSTVMEVESATGSDQLDMELIIDTQGATHLLQVRPLVVPASVQPTDRTVQRAIDFCAHKLRSESDPIPELLGLKPFFSNMADWNPVELIGQRPSPLAMSLFRELVTDRTWAEQRVGYGYRDLRGVPLLHEFAGQPYTDVRAALLSYMPRALPDAVARRIVSSQLQQLAAEVHLHDRLEFDVAVTAVCFDIDTRMRRLAEGGLSADACAHLQSELAHITSLGIERLDRDTAMIDLARSKRTRICAYSPSPLLRACELLNEIQAAAVLPFANVARAAFIATAFSRSAVTEGLATTESVAEYMLSLRTVVTQIREDGAAVGRGELSWADFVERYGELRPGTYDPTVPRYRDEPEVYLRPFTSPAPAALPSPDRVETWFTAPHGRVTAHLEQCGISCDATNLVDFASKAITAREAGKFEWSCWISAILQSLVEAGAELGHTADDVSYWRLPDVRQLASGSLDDRGLRSRVTHRRSQHEITRRLHLPPTMSSLTDLRCFPTQPSKPTYVGTGKSIGPVHLEPDPADSLRGIVVLSHADPGFEWLFSRPLQGIITMLGGANSHMVVRCAELNIPAAIGVGEEVYAELVNASLVQLDCAGQVIEIIR